MNVGRMKGELCNRVNQRGALCNGHIGILPMEDTDNLVCIDCGWDESAERNANVEKKKAVAPAALTPLAKAYRIRSLLTNIKQLLLDTSAPVDVISVVIADTDAEIYDLMKHPLAALGMDSLLNRRLMYVTIDRNKSENGEIHVLQEAVK
ncbi:MAG: hypothetical protein ABW007_19120 [Chitinophagaceae bacterium]